MPGPAILQAMVLHSLSSQQLPRPSLAWLWTLVSARTPPPPIASLCATARARLLGTDLTTPSLLHADYVSSHCLPPDIANPKVRNTNLDRDVVLQVLDIENLSKSRWSQVEELEALARGEGQKGREIIRLPVGGEGEDGERGERGMTQAPTQRQTQAGGVGAGRGAAAGATAAGAAGSSYGTHRLLLQDCKGQKIFGLELRNVEQIGIGKTNIGEKILVKSGASVSRGVIMLEPATCTVLGGKVEAWHKAWVEGRLAKLRETTIANRGG